MKKISFIQPSRNNLKYLKWSYHSIRKNLDPEHEICVASDFSQDGTVEWCEEISKIDKNFKYIVNEGPDRLGHTILYDRLINEVATNDITMIWHADMYACPGLDIEIDKYIEKGTVVSATRIEPPLHPPGPEKIIKDFGIEPEEFDEQGLLDWLNYQHYYEEHETTEGIFAPWAIYKSDFQAIGGHDPIFAPQSKEDSDIFNRFLLNGYKFIQTWRGFVYHMTCRGSRFKDGAKRNPDGKVFMKDRETHEWLKQNEKSTREFIRKWGSFIKHNALMKPVVSHKYDIGFVVKNCDLHILDNLEPLCSTFYTDLKEEEILNYLIFEQSKSSFNLREKIKSIDAEKHNDIIVEFDVLKLNGQSTAFLFQLPEIIADSGEIGSFEYDIFKITIKSLQTYENELIFISKEN